MRILPLLLLLSFATSAFGAAVQCTIHESPIACQQRADQEAANEKAYREGVQKKLEMNKELADARARFWATYPDKPGFEAARDKFVELLHNKDIYYLILFCSTDEFQKSTPGVPMGKFAEFFDRYVGGQQLDHGISQPSLPEFQDWIDAFTKHLKQHGGLFTFQAATNAFQALAESQAEYDRYVLARDWGEFDLVNRVPVGYEQPRNYAAMLYFRFGHLPQQAGFDTVASMVKVLGADAIDRAANQVKAAAKEHDGTLVVTFAPPMKTGPGGGRVPDDTVPMPSNVIGLYVGQLKAFEALATRDDDRRYLLDLIAANTSAGPGEKNFHLGKWERAASAYDRYVWAFGEPEVLAVSHQVRAAVKRASDFSVMDPKALGSTRQAPYAAFEDVLARKDSRGYVRSMLAFAKRTNSKPDLDAAYRDFVAAPGEAKVLDTAAKIAANRPELASDFDILTKALNGTLSVDKPLVNTVDDWQYVSWKGFAPGAQATYISRGLAPDRPGSTNLVPGQVNNRATFKLQSITDDQARLWLSEIAYNYPSFRPTPAHDTEMAYPSKMQAPRPDTRSPAIENGQETLTVAGKQLATRWQSVSYTNRTCTNSTKLWISDQVPGGMVRKLETEGCAGRPTTHREQFLEAFQGARQPGVTDIFEARAAEGTPAPAAPTVPNIYVREPPRKGAVPATPAPPPPANPDFTDPAYPNYYLSDTAINGWLQHYCQGMYLPPGLTAAQNQLLSRSRALVDQDIKTCVAWFDVRQVRTNRKQAMRFCLSSNNFTARGQTLKRKDYDACMNQNDIVTALCTQELNVRTPLEQGRNYRGGTFTCPAQAPASNGENAMVLQGGREDMGHPLTVAAPGLPPLLQTTLPKGFLRGGIPLVKP